MGIFDISNSVPGPIGSDSDVDIDLDISAGATVTGDFNSSLLDQNSLEAPIIYEFSLLSGSGGTLVVGDSGSWSFSSDGSAEVGDSVSFTVTSPNTDLYVLDENGSPVADPETGLPLTVIGSDTDTVTITFTCFAAGTRIDTEHGPCAIEQIQPEDRIHTRDHGLQPVRWIGARELRTPGALGAVVIASGALGNAAELRVSPAHRILIRGWRAQALTGEAEVLVAARDLINGDTIWQDCKTPVTYYHMLFDAHEIVRSEGLESESYHPTTTGLKDLSPATRDEVLMLFPELAERPETYGPAARPTIAGAMARELCL